MFTIRNDHLEAFNKDIRKRFEDRMVAHLHEYFPQQCQTLGEEQVRAWIEHGITRAASYGIIAERDVCKYIDVMFVYGRDFDTDTRYPWAAPILKAHPVDPSDKTAKLFETARRAAHTRGQWHG